jgi:predicted DNA-binding protein with PD1-like motif
VLLRKIEGSAEAIKVLPIRLIPGADLRLSLEKVLADQGEQAGWVLSGIGSLSTAPLRLAGKEELTILEGDLEILTLAGSLSSYGAHLHIGVADSNGVVSGGHLAGVAKVRTNAVVLVAYGPPGHSAGSLIPPRGSRSCRSAIRSVANPAEPLPHPTSTGSTHSIGVATRTHQRWESAPVASLPAG